MTSWMPLLRLAWRDLRRNKGRSVVVFLMLMLPVLGVSAASTVIATADVSGTEGVSRALGAADVTVSVSDWNAGGPRSATAIDTIEPRVREAFGADTRTLLRLSGGARVSTDKGAKHVDVAEVDLRDPLLAGTFRLEGGRLPQSASEVVVNRELAEGGPGLGEQLEVRDGATLKVVGIVEDAFSKDPARAWGLRGSLIADPSAPGALGDVTVFANTQGIPDWKRLGALDHDNGFFSTTRADQAQMYGGSGVGDIGGPDLAVFVLVVVMALTEVVLLAGPAFAVSARRRQRELALVAANGGTPRQVRTAVLASALVIGVLAAGFGAVGGVGVGWLVAPVAERFQSSWFGPRDWSPVQVAGVALFGLVSAVLAALVPSWIASRQDVVRVLTGRRGDPAPARLSPVLGIVLMVVGAALTFIGVSGSGYGEIWIGFGAVSTVLGAVALLPLILRIVAGLLGSAPLVVRYAVRDGLRHRTRTVPAIGAVMATVAGVVALGIANSSDQAAGEKTYEPRLPMGHAQISLWGAYSDAGDDVAEQWTSVIPAVKAIAPDAVVVRGVGDADDTESLAIRDGKQELYAEYMGPFNYGIAVSSSVPDIDLGLSAGEIARADAVLARGGLVVVDAHPDTDRRITALTVARSAADPDDPDGAMKEKVTIDVAAEVFRVSRVPSAGVIMSDAAADRLGVKAATSGVLINRTVSSANQKLLREAVTDVTDNGEVYVERGWQPDPEYAIIMLVLTVVGALLMVGGTLTATVLALADAGPDLATLSAVGAAPRTSRAVAMGIAFVIGGIGASLGVVVGAVPGIAATWPMSNGYAPYGYGGGMHTIDIPWLLLAEIAVGVPVLLALAVGLFARSRLPIVARIE